MKSEYTMKTANEIMLKNFVFVLVMLIVFAVTVAFEVTRDDSPPKPNPVRYVMEGKDCTVLVKQHTVRVECQLEAQ